MLKMLAAALGGVCLAMQLPAQARNPRFDAAVPASAQGAVEGRVVRFNGGYTLRVREASGAIDNVTLHQGTIINPTGLTLERGMTVRITGKAAGNSLAADRIDTPYQVINGFAYYRGQPWDGSGSDPSAILFSGGSRRESHGGERGGHGGDDAGDNGPDRGEQRGGGDHGGNQGNQR